MYLDEEGQVEYENLIKEIVNIPMTNKTITALLELLDFAERASRVMCDLELQNGSIKNAHKMKEYGNAALDISDMLHKHINIGQPDSGTMN